MNSTTQLQRNHDAAVTIIEPICIIGLNNKKANSPKADFDSLFLEAGTQMAEAASRPMVELKLIDTESFLRVLHVDDDDCFLKISKQILEMEDKIKVETATSADEAFENLKQSHYDVVVSDYEMPGKIGLQFLEELKKIGKSTPFILFTGKERGEVEVKALNFGAFRYLNKYGDPEKVYAELASCIQQAGLTRVECSPG